MQTLKQEGLNKVVFWFSAAIVLIFSLFTIFFNEASNNLILTLLNLVSENFSWYYLLAAALYFLFVIYIAFSHFGKIKLGPSHSKPEFKLLTWFAMLFSAGIGIDLLFFSVAEPISHYMHPPVLQGQTMLAAREAVMWTLFHYGVTGWSMYALIGMALAYFCYRLNMPLSLRSALYPIFGDRVHGWIGHIVDITAVLGAIFGIATTCGIGVVQLNYGLYVLLGLPIGVKVQLCLITLAVGLSILSALTGIYKGIRYFSEINVLVAIGLILYMLVFGNTEFLLKAYVQNIGDYITRLPGLTFETFAFDNAKNWLQNWTIFFWAWWVAWAPFVGLFLARISRGRTIREFILATLIIPFIFVMTWLSVFGNSALYNVIFDGNINLANTVLIDASKGFYDLLAQYPGFTFVASVATLSGLLFYVTSADSGALVLGYFTYKFTTNDGNVPKRLTFFWSIAIGLLTIAMLMANGVTALQNATIIMGLPFSLVMFFIIVGLIKAFRIEDHIINSRKDSSHLNSSNFFDWRDNLEKTMSYPNITKIKSVMEQICLPALMEVKDEFINKGLTANIKQADLEDDLYYIELAVDFSDKHKFIYQIHPQKYKVPNLNIFNNFGQEEYYRLETFLTDGSQNNDLSENNKEEVINDVLHHYKNYMNYIKLTTK